MTIFYFVCRSKPQSPQSFPDQPSPQQKAEFMTENKTPIPKENFITTPPAAKDLQHNDRTREVLRGALDKLASKEDMSQKSKPSVPQNPWDNKKWERSPWEQESGNAGPSLQLEEKKDSVPGMPVLEKQDPVTLTFQSQVNTGDNVYM